MKSCEQLYLVGACYCCNHSCRHKTRSGESQGFLRSSGHQRAALVGWSRIPLARPFSSLLDVTLLAKPSLRFTWVPVAPQVDGMVGREGVMDVMSQADLDSNTGAATDEQFDALFPLL